MQRLFILLAPEGSAFPRLIAIGRKRLPRSARRERFWGFVDLVLTDNDMNAALDAQVYGTKTRGLRHLPAARAVASGSYEIEMHSSHSHLRWQIEPLENVVEIEIEPTADYIVTIANPDPAVWGLVEPPDLQTQLFDDLELHVPLPTPFPPALQEEFRQPPLRPARHDGLAGSSRRGARVHGDVKSWRLVVGGWQLHCPLVVNPGWLKYATRRAGRHLSSPNVWRATTGPDHGSPANPES